jgi:hypothetical protein
MQFQHRITRTFVSLYLYRLLVKSPTVPPPKAPPNRYRTTCRYNSSAIHMGFILLLSKLSTVLQALTYIFRKSSDSCDETWLDKFFCFVGYFFLVTRLNLLNTRVFTVATAVLHFDLNLFDSNSWMDLVKTHINISILIVPLCNLIRVNII